MRHYPSAMLVAALSLTALACATPLERFWMRLGVAPGSVRMARLQKLTTDVPEFSSDLDALDASFDALCSAIGPKAARAVLLRSPLTLARDNADELPQKLAALSELLPHANAGRVVAKAPALLEMDIETLRPRVTALQTLLGVDAASRVVVRAPTLLQLVDVAPRLQELERMLPGADVRGLVQRAPSLLAYDAELLRTKLGQLAALFEGQDVQAMVRRGAPSQRLEPTPPRRCTLPRCSRPGAVAHARLSAVPDSDRTRIAPGSHLDRTRPHATHAEPSLLTYDIERSLAAKARAALPAICLSAADLLTAHHPSPPQPRPLPTIANRSSP